MDKFGEAQLNQTLLLKTTMDIVPNLAEALNNAISGRLKKMKMVYSCCQFNISTCNNNIHQKLKQSQILLIA